MGLGYIAARGAYRGAMKTETPPLLQLLGGLIAIGGGLGFAVSCIFGGWRSVIDTTPPPLCEKCGPNPAMYDINIGGFFTTQNLIFEGIGFVGILVLFIMFCVKYK